MGYDIISVKFNKYLTQEYSFMSDIKDLKVNDLVVVHTKNGYSCARVTKLDGDREKATDYVVCKVDVSEFEQIHKLKDNK